MDEKVKQWIRDNNPAMIKDLQALVRIPSTLGPAEEGKPYGKAPYDSLIAALEIGENLGFAGKNIDGYCGVLDCGEGSETLGILGHLDVVPEGNGWKYPPYGAEIHDDKIWGRGTIDDKGPVIAALYGLAAVKNSGYKFNRKVRVFMGCNEESDMGCLKYYLTKEPAPTLSFTPDGVFPLSISEKSILHLTYRKDYKSNINMHVGAAVNICPGYAKASVGGKDYECTGVQVHGSSPYLGKNAIQMMFIELNKLGLEGEDGKVLKALTDKFGMECRGESLGLDRSDDSGRQTLNIGICNFDETGFEMSIDMRCPSSYTEEQLCGPIDKLMESIGAKRTNTKFTQGYSVSKDSEIASKLLKVYQNHSGNFEKKPVSMGGGTYAKYVPQAVSFGPASAWLEASDCHVADEFISLDLFTALAETYADAIIALACFR